MALFEDDIKTKIRELGEEQVSIIKRVLDNKEIIEKLSEENANLRSELEALKALRAEDSARITALQSEASELKNRIETSNFVPPNDGGKREVATVPALTDMFPFKVFFDENDTANIYLPQGSCYYGGKEVEYPEGVSNDILAIPQCKNNVWGLIKKYKAGGSSSEKYKLSFANGKGSLSKQENEDGSTETTIVNFLIAKLDDGVQVVHSAVSFGGGSSGEVGFPQFTPGNNKISGGVVCIARQYYYVNGIEKALVDGPYRLKFTYNAVKGSFNNIVIEEGDGFEAPTDDISYAPLFTIKDGEISGDYRGAAYLMVRE